MRSCCTAQITEMESYKTQCEEGKSTSICERNEAARCLVARRVYFTEEATIRQPGRQYGVKYVEAQIGLRYTAARLLRPRSRVCSNVGWDAVVSNGRDYVICIQRSQSRSVASPICSFIAASWSKKRWLLAAGCGRSTAVGLLPIAPLYVLIDCFCSGSNKHTTILHLYWPAHHLFTLR